MLALVHPGHPWCGRLSPSRNQVVYPIVNRRLVGDLIPPVEACTWGRVLITAVRIGHHSGFACNGAAQPHRTR
ncbi:hypothetical protein located in a region devoid of annotation [Frankia alni ACN14a]|uniref:Uncharacterized protein n=1 Tax=Frankia alni (strain DSM 45986 / CECT 9034 / ACN14a) TaxID=326424 RepID=Q0RGM9_FRAAA|nr:hypothetical protein located in a region devoid of annotation [Frankia alni ACN14a]